MNYRMTRRLCAIAATMALTVAACSSPSENEPPATTAADAPDAAETVVTAQSTTTVSPATSTSAPSVESAEPEAATERWDALFTSAESDSDGSYSGTLSVFTQAPSGDVSIVPFDVTVRLPEGWSACEVEPDSWRAAVVPEVQPFFDARSWDLQMRSADVVEADEPAQLTVEFDVVSGDETAVLTVTGEVKCADDSEAGTELGATGDDAGSETRDEAGSDEDTDPADDAEADDDAEEEAETEDEGGADQDTDPADDDAEAETEDEGGADEDTDPADDAEADDDAEEEAETEDEGGADQDADPADDAESDDDAEADGEAEPQDEPDETEEADDAQPVRLRRWNHQALINLPLWSHCPPEPEPADLAAKLDGYDRTWANWDSATYRAGDIHVAAGWWTDEQLAMWVPDGSVTAESARQHATYFPSADTVALWPKHLTPTLHSQSTPRTLKTLRAAMEHRGLQLASFARMLVDTRDGIAGEGAWPENIRPGILLTSWTTWRYAQPPTTQEPVAWPLRSLFAARESGCVAKALIAMCASNDPVPDGVLASDHPIGRVLRSLACGE